jgi:hypothetical protein
MRTNKIEIKIRQLNSFRVVILLHLFRNVFIDKFWFILCLLRFKNGRKYKRNIHELLDFHLLLLSVTQ